MIETKKTSEKGSSAKTDHVIQLLEYQRTTLESTGNKLFAISAGWLAIIGLVIGFQFFSFQNIKKEIREELNKEKSDLYADMADAFSGSPNETMGQAFEQRMFYSFSLAIKSENKSSINTHSEQLRKYLEFELSRSDPPTELAGKISLLMSLLPTNLRSISTEQLGQIVSKIKANSPNQSAHGTR